MVRAARFLRLLRRILHRAKTFFDAVTLAKKYITGAIEHSLSIGKGYGPTHHFFELYAKAGIG